MFYACCLIFIENTTFAKLEAEKSMEKNNKPQIHEEIEVGLWKMKTVWRQKSILPGNHILFSKGFQWIDVALHMFFKLIDLLKLYWFKIIHFKYSLQSTSIGTYGLVFKQTTGSIIQLKHKTTNCSRISVNMKDAYCCIFLIIQNSCKI